MARIRKKAQATPAKPGTKIQLKWVRSAIAAPLNRSWWSRDWVSLA